MDEQKYLLVEVTTDSGSESYALHGITHDEARRVLDQAGPDGLCLFNGVDSDGRRGTLSVNMSLAVTVWITEEK
jgi:hypothetical protein